MSQVTLHLCNLSEASDAAAHLPRIDSQDIVLLYGNSGHWLNSAFVERCQQAAAEVYGVGIQQQGLQKIDHAEWAILISKADTIYAWK